MPHFTDLRVATCDGEISRLAERYGRFFQLPLGRSDVHKYAHLREERSGSYVFMVSDADAPYLGYNVVLSVMGKQKERVTELMDDMVRSMEIEARPAPDELQQRAAALNALLEGLL